MGYVLAFFSAVLVDSIPIFAPPAWPILVIILVFYDLNPWLVILLGVAGTSLGRVILSIYMPWIGHRLVNHWEGNNLKFLGERLSQPKTSSFLFVFFYSLTPLSTTALFTAAGMAKVAPWCILLPFFLGKLISYTVLILSGSYLASDATRLVNGFVSWQAVTSGILALVILGGMLFIDWRELIVNKRMKLRFAVWKHG